MSWILMLSFSVHGQSPGLHQDALFFYTQLEDFQQWLHEVDTVRSVEIDSLEIFPDHLRLRLLIPDSIQWDYLNQDYAFWQGLSLEDSLARQFCNMMAIHADSVQIYYQFSATQQRHVVKRSGGRTFAEDSKRSTDEDDLSEFGAEEGSDEAIAYDPNFMLDKESEDQYRIIAIQGLILHETSGKALQRGSLLKAQDKIRFKTPDAGSSD
ncbi:MAG: hypothetical protein HC880_20180, partial [Bacteroidia bacterium]|nr:hypothetical protein [Bacteroidia bacterium]